MYGLTLTSAPATEPVTLAEARLWLKVDSDMTDDDALISSLIVAARVLCEQHLGRAFVTQSWKVFFERFPWGWSVPALPPVQSPGPAPVGYGTWGWRIPKAPLVSVASIKYFDVNNVQQTLSTSIYTVDTAQDPGLVYLSWTQVWPLTYYWRRDAVEIAFTAGYGSASAVPETIKTAIKFCLAPWYQNRQAGTLPDGVRWLLDAEFHGCPEYGEIEP